MANLVKLSFDKIEASNITLEIYRLFPKDYERIENFYALSQKQKDYYKFASIDQDTYLANNTIENNKIVLYDVDKDTYDNSVKFDRTAQGVTYYSYLSAKSFSDEPVWVNFLSDGMHDYFYNTNAHKEKVTLRYKLVAKNPHACVWDESHSLN